MLRWFIRFLLLLLAGTLPALAAIDRNPELKSRALAWTEYDGSYLVDTSSRAEMVDFYWNVFAKPYPDIGWTGSLNHPVAGEISEAYRVREYAQLNAYRAMNYSQPITEDPTHLAGVQAASLIFYQNDRVAHLVTPDWIGYNETAAWYAGRSQLAAIPSRFADAFIDDGGEHNANLVGHRTTLLHDNTRKGTLGAVKDSVGVLGAWYQPRAADHSDNTDFVAWPAPGYMPSYLFTREIRWSFRVKTDIAAYNAASNPHYSVASNLPRLDATLVAKVNGVVTPVKQFFNDGILTWHFDEATLPFNLRQVPDGTTVEIAIKNIGISDTVTGLITQYRDYNYTVRLFDPQKIVPVGYTPQTPLVNLSTRGVIGAGDRQMIAGFIIGGTLPVRVAVRSQGPSLAKHGISHPAGSTQLKVYDQDGQLLGENSGWKSHPDWRLLQSLQVNPGADNEAGMVLTLWPGRYTAVVSDATGANGIGIVEAFNIDNQSVSPIANLSTRGNVGANEKQMIAGFVVNGSKRRIAIRTQGPGLAQHGVSGPVADTALKIVDQGTGATLAQNRAWKADPRNEPMKSELAWLAPSDEREAALIVDLEPGTYTALVEGEGSEGVGIVEVFDVTPQPQQP